MYLFWERTGVRSPGFFEVSWNRCSMALDLIYDEDADGLPWMIHVHFLWFNLFLHFPAPRLKTPHSDHWGEWKQWGFTFSDFGPHFHWGWKTKCLDWPWQSTQISHEVRRADGSWVPFVGSWEHDKEPDGKELLTYGYKYVLRNGTIQLRTATISVERRTRRQHWLSWTPRFDKASYGIDVAFSGEVGERTGSWKGGCVGCGYTMLPYETPELCLRRMERERKFQ